MSQLSQRSTCFVEEDDGPSCVVPLEDRAKICPRISARSPSSPSCFGSRSGRASPVCFVASSCIIITSTAVTLINRPLNDLERVVFWSPRLHHFAPVLRHLQACCLATRRSQTSLHPSNTTPVPIARSTRCAQSKQAHERRCEVLRLQCTALRIQM